VEGICDRLDVPVADDDARPLPEQLLRMRETGRATGLPDAIASTSTPETTCSRERYGRSTMSASCISAKLAFEER